MNARPHGLACVRHTGVTVEYNAESLAYELMKYPTAKGTTCCDPAFLGSGHTPVVKLTRARS